MPVMDGLEATREIRRREDGTGQHIPIIAMTAHAMPGDEDRCIAAGMDHYVAKPVKPDVLQAALARWSRPAERRAPATAGVAAAAVFDPDRLDELAGSDTNFRREILSDFLTLAPDLLARIDSALAAGDARDVEKASHSLKGSSRTLGAGGLGAICEELEGLGRAGALDAARGALARAHDELARLRAALGLYLRTRDGGAAGSSDASSPSLVSSGTASQTSENISHCAGTSRTTSS
jgi:CheY-like chemotaxis protein